MLDFFLPSYELSTNSKSPSRPSIPSNSDRLVAAVKEARAGDEETEGGTLGIQYVDMVPVLYSELGFNVCSFAPDRLMLWGSVYAINSEGK